MLESASRATNRELARIKKRLDEMYSVAAKEIREKADKYTASFYALDEKKRALVASGRMTKEAYRDWREQKVFVGARWRTLEMELAERLTNTDKAAIAYVNGRLPSVYTTNYNALARGVNGLGVGVRFDLVNEHTIKYLATTDKTLLPYKNVNGKKAERWHTQRVNAEVAQGILQGESMQEIAKRLEQNVGMTAEGSAMRNAKLAVGSAQNKGRMDMMLDMEKKGLVVKKRWTTIHDTRTRDAHIELDGVEQDLHKPFVNSIGEIDYPKSPDAAPANVYNCRCEIITHIMGVRNPETGAYTDLSGIQTFRNPPFPQKATKKVVRDGIMKGVKMLASTQTVQKVAQSVNKNYGKGREYSENCANCVVASEARFRGYDVVARERDYSRGNHIPSFWYDNKFGRGSWTDSFSGMVGETVNATRKTQTVGAISKKMLEYGNGSRAVIFVKWDGKQIGHYFSVVNDGGHIVFFDSQNGKVGTSVEDYFSIARPSATRIWRVDDKKMTDFVLKVVKKDE